MNDTFPTFQPLPWLRGGHAQTLAGLWIRGSAPAYTARKHYVNLPDGDRLVLHDDCPPGWRTGGPTALLLHGLCGSYRSRYMERAAARLKDRGVRAFRMDQRGCGAGMGLARRPYHAGCSSDLARALQFVAGLCPESPTAVVGYSLGGNVVLKLAGETPQAVPRNVCSVMAVNPAIDLAAAAAMLQTPRNRFYHSYFLKFLWHIVRGLPVFTGSAARASFRSLDSFNEFVYTRVWKFGTLERFYSVCSSLPTLGNIQVPTLIVASADDPIVPVHSFRRARLSAATRLVITERGGHLGFIGKAKPNDPDHFWIDWRMLNWVDTSLSLSQRLSA